MKIYHKSYHKIIIYIITLFFITSSLTSCRTRYNPKYLFDKTEYDQQKRPLYNPATDPSMMGSTGQQNMMMQQQQYPNQSGMMPYPNTSQEMMQNPSMQPNTDMGGMPPYQSMPNNMTGDSNNMMMQNQQMMPPANNPYSQNNPYTQNMTSGYPSDPSSQMMQNPQMAAPTNNPYPQNMTNQPSPYAGGMPPSQYNNFSPPQSPNTTMQQPMTGNYYNQNIPNQSQIPTQGSTYNPAYDQNNLRQQNNDIYYNSQPNQMMIQGSGGGYQIQPYNLNQGINYMPNQSNMMPNNAMGGEYSGYEYLSPEELKRLEQESKQ